MPASFASCISPVPTSYPSSFRSRRLLPSTPRSPIRLSLTMGLFDKLKQGLAEDQATAEDRRPRPVQVAGTAGRRIVFHNELFEFLVKTRYGRRGGARDRRRGLQRPAGPASSSWARSLERIKEKLNSLLAQPAEPIQFRRQRTRRSSWWPASTAAARPPRSPSSPRCSRTTARRLSSARPTRFGPPPSNS